MARVNLQIKVGKYTGNATDNRTISGIGFRPDLVIIKDGTTATNNAVFKTKEMIGDATGFMASTNAGLTDRIQSIMNDGFQVGTAAQVNSNNEVYYYLAIRGVAGQSHFRTGKYTGDGSDNRNFTTGGLNFTPDLVFLQRSDTGLNSTRWLSSSVSGDNAGQFDNAANAANGIQNLQSNGFQLGSANSCNQNGSFYFFVAMKVLSGVFAVGSFTGNGTTQAITGVGFQPSLVIVKNQNTTDMARLWTSDMSSDAVNSPYMGSTASDANGITALGSDGFTVGSSASANGNGNTIHYMAFKSGDFNAPVSRTTA